MLNCINLISKLYNDESGGESIEMALVTSTLAVGSIASYKSVSATLGSGLGGIVDGIGEGTTVEP